MFVFLNNPNNYSFLLSSIVFYDFINSWLPPLYRNIFIVTYFLVFLSQNTWQSVKFLFTIL